MVKVIDAETFDMRNIVVVLLLNPLSSETTTRYALPPTVPMRPVIGFNPGESTIGPMEGPTLKIIAVVDPVELIKLISNDPLGNALHASFLLSMVKFGSWEKPVVALKRTAEIRAAMKMAFCILYLTVNSKCLGQKLSRSFFPTKTKV